MLKIRMYPAKNGDALLVLHQDSSTAVLIDGGYASTFQNYILPDLQRIVEKGDSLSLVIATHIDADHISGLLQFFKMNGSADAPKIIAVQNVWHNSLRSITAPIPPAERAETMETGDEELLLEVRRSGYPLPSVKDGFTSEISARQGSSLAALLLAGGYRWNEGVGREAISSSPYKPNTLNQNVSLSVVGPPLSRLQSLAEQWMAELRRLGFTGRIHRTEAFDDAFEFMSAVTGTRARGDQKPISGILAADGQLNELYVPDVSLTNASSISFILQADKHQLLFLGDSWPDDIEAVLQESLSVKYKSNECFLFDAIKISHHGSRHNTSPALLNLIDAPVFLVSSSGERHNHPDLDVLKAIVDRPAAFTRRLYFNYCTPASEWMKTYVSRSGATFSVHEGVQEIVIQNGLHKK